MPPAFALSQDQTLRFRSQHSIRSHRHSTANQTLPIPKHPKPSLPKLPNIHQRIHKQKYANKHPNAAPEKTQPQNAQEPEKNPAPNITKPNLNQNTRPTTPHLSKNSQKDAANISLPHQIQLSMNNTQTDCRPAVRAGLPPDWLAHRRCRPTTLGRTHRGSKQFKPCRR